jgi:hypothetical protein
MQRFSIKLRYNLGAIVGQFEGHNFTACGKVRAVEQEASGHDFTACGKVRAVEQEASGHDFSRAENAIKNMSGFSP